MCCLSLVPRLNFSFQSSQCTPYQVRGSFFLIAYLLLSMSPKLNLWFNCSSWSFSSRHHPHQTTWLSFHSEPTVSLYVWSYRALQSLHEHGGILHETLRIYPEISLKKMNSTCILLPSHRPAHTSHILIRSLILSHSRPQRQHAHLRLK